MNRKLIKLQEEIDEFTITVRDFNIALSEMKINNRQKKKLIRTYLYSTALSIDWKSSTSVDHFIQQQENIHYSQALLE